MNTPHILLESHLQGMSLYMNVFFIVLDLNFCEETDKQVKGFPVCICPLNGLFSWPSFFFTFLCFFFCNWIACRSLEADIETNTLYHEYLRYTSVTQLSFTLFIYCNPSLSSDMLLGIEFLKLCFLFCSAPYMVIHWKILKKKTEQQRGYVSYYFVYKNTLAW